jgi:hypothetical protein
MTLLAVDFRLKKAENNSTMPSTVINDIEREFAQLSREVQLSLLERLLRHVRLSETGPNDTWEAELSEMAADPQIRREIDCFNADTLVTEADGLRGD